MIKRALRFAIGPSVGVVVGSLAYRVMNPHLYNETWPSFAAQSVLYLLVSYAVCFLVGLLVAWINSRRNPS